MSTPTDPRPSTPANAGGEVAPSAYAPAERRPRLSRPTPSHLFAERRDEGHGPRRATRVIPALAEKVGLSTSPGEAAAGAAPPPAPPGAPETNAGSSSEHAPEFPPDIVLIVRTGGIVLYVNRPLGRRSEEEVVGSQFTDWLFPEQHAAVREALERVFASGRADGVELHGIQGHDPDAWFECRISPNQREGKVVSVTVIARDVTRYKQIEHALTERTVELQRQLDDRIADLDLLRTEVASGRPRGHPGGDTRLQDALQTAGEAIFLLDPATESIVDLNDTASRWLRRHRGEVLGRPVADLDIQFPLLPPVGFDVQFTETRDTRRSLTLEGEHRRRDGSTFPVEVTVMGYEDEGREYYLAIARDAKDRRRAQEAIQEAEVQWRALFEQSFDAVYLTTRGGEIVEANPAALALFGYRRDEMIGLDARLLMPNVSDIRHFQRVMAAERFVAEMEATMRRQDGSAFVAVLSASRRRDGRDRLLGYQWVVRAAESKNANPAAPGPATGGTRRSVTLVQAPVAHLPRFTPPEAMRVAPDATESAEAAPATPVTEAVDPAVVQETPAPEVREPRASGDPWGESMADERGGVVLLVGGRAAGRRDAVQALERAGFAVLDAADATGAIRMLRTHGDTVDVAVIAGEVGAEPEDIARDLEALAQGLAVVLVRAEEQDQTPPTDLPDALVLREPVHPLALLQSVRQARTRG